MPKALTPAAVSLLRAVADEQTQWPADTLIAELLLAGFVKRGVSRWLVTEAGSRYLRDSAGVTLHTCIKGEA